jgi:hypothetical protein
MIGPRPARRKIFLFGLFGGDGRAVPSMAVDAADEGLAKVRYYLAPPHSLHFSRARARARRDGCIAADFFFMIVWSGRRREVVGVASAER